MENPTQRPSILGKIRNKFRHGLIFLVMSDYLKKMGIEITPFYWMRETIPDQSPAGMETNFRDFDFSFFGPEDIEAICKHPERKFYHEEHVTKLFKAGKKCYGAKCNGEIAGFTWIDLEESVTKFHPSKMKSNEAYLFDMYVFKSFRGRNLAPILRYKTYAILKELGRDTCYSVTVCYNTPSIKFKQKLNAQFVFLGLYVNLFKKIRKRWVLKRY
ncbi:MAG: GNAT family N-acetyltransferase [Candidatus Omnitrophota bacterium]|nr:GNAT family N-acetyltransferase [Candidatus Omnitrophota bacterium]MDZ4242358.1 GNAT family N-acetyltransferase [Candidatus Omnitrophota bacterium]